MMTGQVESVQKALLRIEENSNPLFIYYVEEDWGGYMYISKITLTVENKFVSYLYNRLPNILEDQPHLLDGLESLDKGAKLLWWKQTTLGKLDKLEKKMDTILRKL